MQGFHNLWGNNYAYLQPVTYSKTDKTFTDSSADCDESENSFSIQSFRHWCKIDMQIIAPAPASFPFLGDSGPNFTMANDATILNFFLTMLCC